MTPSAPRLSEWVAALAAESGQRLEVILTRNRYTLVSLRRQSSHRSTLRLHLTLAEAPDTFFQDLSRVITHNDPAAWRRVSAHARELDLPPPPDRKRRPRRTSGQHVDLRREFDWVCRHCFVEAPEADICWGQGGRSRLRRRRSIRFGSWHAAERLVRIHPLLDQPWVPREFIQYLIYHELCHAVAQPQRASGGRRRIHHSQFQELEALFPDLEEMEAWSRKILQRLRREGL